MTGHAFVAGATGYTGRAVVRELVARGVPTVAHVRSDSPRLSEWRRRFAALGATVDASPWQTDALRTALTATAPNLVFALLGTTRGRTRRAAAAGRDSSYQAVDYGLSHLLLDVTRAASPAARFIYLSSLGVSPRTTNEYLAVRWRIEQELRSSGLDFLIARPSFITGPDREEVRVLERAAAGLVDGALRIGGWLGGAALRDQFASLTGDQLGRALVVAALTPGLARQTLDTRALRKLA
ncbi:MAG: SDR family oxidoreductase [Longimicrobiales bacterium]